MAKGLLVTDGTSFSTGSGCASVLNIHWLSGRMESSENKRYKYLSVSAMKNDCCTSSLGDCELYTSLIPE